MLRIGYVRLRETRSADDTSLLKANGCHVVRAEEPDGPHHDDHAVLASILDFIGSGDQLVVTRLGDLGGSARALLDVVERLQARGASLHVLDTGLTTEADDGRTLRTVLETLAGVEPASAGRRRRGAPAPEEIKALQDAGVGPVEIARRLGVSRMTVWRKLRALEA
jgi:DNA invertase Pin-like site-specific DNA recombinase